MRWVRVGVLAVCVAALLLECRKESFSGRQDLRQRGRRALDDGLTQQANKRSSDLLACLFGVAERPADQGHRLDPPGIDGRYGRHRPCSLPRRQKESFVAKEQPVAKNEQPSNVHLATGKAKGVEEFARKPGDRPFRNFRRCEVPRKIRFVGIRKARTDLTDPSRERAPGFTRIERLDHRVAAFDSHLGRTAKERHAKRDLIARSRQPETNHAVAGGNLETQDGEPFDASQNLRSQLRERVQGVDVEKGSRRREDGDTETGFPPSLERERENRRQQTSLGDPPSPEPGPHVLGQ